MTEHPSRERILQIIRDFRLIDDDFMSVVFSDRKCAQLLLEIILERKDLHVVSAKPQYEIKNLHGRSVRLDILATDEQGRQYNIEIQRSDKGAVAQRARYNSSLIDANITFPGESYRELPETYVIFITENDVLKSGLPLYHIDRVIRETGRIFEDGAHILYVNSQVQDETALGKLMQDFYCTSAEEMHYAELAEQVKHYKESEKGVTHMCRSVEKLCNDVRTASLEQGLEQGAERALLDSIRSLMKNLGKSADDVMVMLDIPAEEREKYKKLLEQ